MTGSGSAVFAIFDSVAARARAETALLRDALLRKTWTKNGVREGRRLLRAELVNRRGYQRLWQRQLGLGQHPAAGRLSAGEELWPPPNRYAR
jgi:hypothetical protein